MRIGQGDGNMALVPAPTPLSTPQAEASMLAQIDALELEREDLLARYTPQAQPVQAINTRIAQLEAFLEEHDTPAGTVRRGPNPVYQALETSHSTLEADTRALQGQAAELESQLEEINARRTALTALVPDGRSLSH